jgi:1,4-alpha-glucan branching enzyme
MASKSSKKVAKRLTSKPEVLEGDKVTIAENVSPKKKEATKPEAPAESHKPILSREVRVTFVLLESDAKSVSVSGEFNGWSKNANPMKRHADGHWEATLDLLPGRYQYKFIVDGQWRPDVLAHENLLNEHGTLNSVIEVRADSLQKSA